MIMSLTDCAESNSIVRWITASMNKQNIFGSISLKTLISSENRQLEIDEFRHIDFDQSLPFADGRNVTTCDTQNMKSSSR